MTVKFVLLHVVDVGPETCPKGFFLLRVHGNKKSIRVVAAVYSDSLQLLDEICFVFAVLFEPRLVMRDLIVPRSIQVYRVNQHQFSDLVARIVRAVTDALGCNSQSLKGGRVRQHVVPHEDVDKLLTALDLHERQQLHHRSECCRHLASAPLQLQLEAQHGLDGE